MKLDLRFKHIIASEQSNLFLGLTMEGKLVALTLDSADETTKIIRASVLEVLLEDERIEGHLPGDSCKCFPCPVDTRGVHNPRNSDIDDDEPDTCVACGSDWNGKHWTPGS